MLFQKLQIKTTVSTNTGLRAAFTVPRQALQSLVLEAQLANPAKEAQVCPGTRCPWIHTGVHRDTQVCTWTLCTVYTGVHRDTQVCRWTRRTWIHVGFQIRGRPWVSMRNRFQDPVDTKIRGCSRPFYEMV